jgi:hypothetical protein
MQNGYDLGDEWVQGSLPRRGTPVEFVVRFNPSGPIAQPKVRIRMFARVFVFEVIRACIHMCVRACFNFITAQVSYIDSTEHVVLFQARDMSYSSTSRRNRDVCA